MPRGGERLRTKNGLMNSVGERVLQRRLALGLTRDQLAARIATETDGEWNPLQDEIYKIQAGKRIVSELELKVLARVLGCPILWLIGEE